MRPSRSLGAGGLLLTSKMTPEGTPARDVFITHPRVVEAQAAHDIKDEYRDAVILVLEVPRSSKREAQTEIWSSALTGDPIDTEQAEEKRIAFVALTRAERICVVALLDDADGRAHVRRVRRQRVHAHRHDDRGLTGSSPAANRADPVEDHIADARPLQGTIKRLRGSDTRPGSVPQGGGPG